MQGLTRMALYWTHKKETISVGPDSNFDITVHNPSIFQGLFLCDLAHQYLSFWWFCPLFLPQQATAAFPCALLQLCFSHFSFCFSAPLFFFSLFSRLLPHQSLWWSGQWVAVSVGNHHGNSWQRCGAGNTPSITASTAAGNWYIKM